MEPQPPSRRLPLPIPVLLGLAVLLVFLPWMLVCLKAAHDARRAIESYDPFALPDFRIRVSKTMKYDPLGVLGRGARAGFWQWTPEGIVLAAAGRPYFSETPEAIACIVGAGRRAVTEIERYNDREGKREVRFHYRWVQITPPARALLSSAPDPGREYEGRALLVKQNDQWRVQWMDTPHFDKPMALLKDEAAEIQR